MSHSLKKIFMHVIADDPVPNKVLVDGTGRQTHSHVKGCGTWVDRIDINPYDHN